jgi:hypothetical protein
MTIDNYMNDLCHILSDIGREYDFQMDKNAYQFARNKIKHFIQNDGFLVEKKNYPDFENYCRKVFEEYMEMK